MSNFPVGSKIIITTPWAGETAYKNGDIFTVDAPEGPGVYVKVSGEKQYIASDEFEAYTEYKVGDKVAVIKTNSEWGYKLGDRGTVDYIDSHEPKVRLKGAGYHFTEDLKLAPAKAEPTPTSHIKVLATRHPREYEVGDILEVHAEQWSSLEAGEIRVVNKHSGNSIVFKGQWEYYTEEPVTTPRQIALKDIQAGDLIKAEYSSNGIKHTREGVAHEAFSVRSTAWATEGRDYVAHESWEGATYTLLERPEAPKPNPFAEAKVGSLALQDDGYVWYKVGSDLWKFLSKFDGGLAASTGETNALMAQDDDRKITYSAP